MKINKILQNKNTVTNTSSVSNGYVNNLLKSNIEIEIPSHFLVERKLLLASYPPEYLDLLEVIGRYGPYNSLNPGLLEIILKNRNGSIYRQIQRGGPKLIEQSIKAELCLPLPNEKSRWTFIQNPRSDIEKFFENLFPGLAIVKIFVVCEEEFFPYELKITLLDKIQVKESMKIYDKDCHDTKYRYMTNDEIDIEIRSNNSKPREYSWRVPPLSNLLCCHRLVISPERGILSS